MDNMLRVVYDIKKGTFPSTKICLAKICSNNSKKNKQVWVDAGRHKNRKK